MGVSAGAPQPGENFKQESLEIIRQLDSSYETPWKNMMEALGDDPNVLKSGFKDYLDSIKSADKSAAEKLKAIGGNLLEELEGIAGVEVTKTSVEDKEGKSIDPEKVKQQEKERRNKARRKRKRNVKIRKIRAAVRQVKRDFLHEKELLYSKLEGASPRKKREIRDRLGEIDKESAKAQLEAYKEAGVDTENPSKRFKQEIFALQRVVDPENKKYKPEKEEKPPSLKALKRKMLAAKKKIDEIGEDGKLALDTSDPPTQETIKRNFGAVTKAQGLIADVSSYTQAAMAKAQEVISEAHTTASRSGIVDKISSWSWVPWKTDNAKKMNEANASLPAVKTRVENEFKPLINRVRGFKDVVVEGAGSLQEQTGKYRDVAKGRVTSLKDRRKQALEAKKRNAETAKDSREEVKEKTLEELKKEHEQHVALIRERKQQMMEMSDKQKEITDQQKFVLENYGKTTTDQIVYHDQAKGQVTSAIKVLESKLASAPDAKKPIIKAKVEALKAKTGEIDKSKGAFTTKLEALGKADAKITIAGTDYRNGVATAIANLNTLENKSIVDFANKVVGIKSVFDQTELTASAMVREDIEATTEAFEEKIEIAEDMEGDAVEVQDKAGMLALSLKVQNIESLDRLDSSKNALANAKEASVGLFSAIGSTVVDGDFVWDFFGMEKDSKWRNYLGNPLLIPFFPLGTGIVAGKAAVRLVETGAKKLDEAWGISDWWHDSIEYMKEPGWGGDTWYWQALAWPFEKSAEVAAGVSDFIVDVGGGLFHLVAHPGQSVDGIVSLIGNPSQWKDVGKALIEYDEWGENNFFAATKVLGNVLLTATGFGAAGTAASSASKAVGAWAKVRAFTGTFAYELGKRGSQAVVNTGKFIITTPFKMLYRAGKLGRAALQGTLATELVAIRSHVAMNKVAELGKQQGTLSDDMVKIIGETNLPSSKVAEFLNRPSLATAADDFATHLSTLGVPGPAQGHAASLFRKAVRLERRMRNIDKVHGVAHMMHLSKPAEALTEARLVNVDKIKFSEYVDLAKAYPSVDELSLAIMRHPEVALSVADDVARAQAKMVAEMLLQEPKAAALKRYIGSRLGHIENAKVIEWYKGALSGDELAAFETRMQQVIAEPGVKAIDFSADAAKAQLKVLGKEPFTAAHNVDDLTRQILEHWDELDHVADASGASKLAPDATHFTNPSQIQAARAYANEVWRVKAQQFGSHIDDLKAAISADDVLKVKPAASAEGGAVARNLKSIASELVDLRTRASAATSPRQAAAIQNRIDTLLIREAMLKGGGNVGGVVSWPFRKVGEIGGVVLQAGGRKIAMGIKYLGATPYGGYRMALEAAKGMKGQPIVFVGKNMDEIAFALRAAIFTRMGITGAAQANALKLTTAVAEADTDEDDEEGEIMLADDGSSSKSKSEKPDESEDDDSVELSDDEVADVHDTLSDSPLGMDFGDEKVASKEPAKPEKTSKNPRKPKQSPKRSEADKMSDEDIDGVYS